MDLSNIRSWWRHTGRVALYLLFGGLFLAPALVSAGMLLSLLSFPFFVSNRGEFVRQPVVLAALACSAYLLVLTSILSLDPPPGSVVRWDEAAEWLQLLLFIPAAYLLRSHRKDLNRLLLLCVAGLMLRILLRMDWELLLNSPLAHFNLREGYGFAALAFALYCGTALLGLLFLRDRCRTWPPRHLADFATLILWLLGALILVQMFLGTQARGAWLSFIAAIGIGTILQHRSRNTHTHHGAVRWLAAAAAMIFGITLLAMTPQGDAIVQRIVSEAHFVEAMINGEEIAVAHSSIALRWNAQVFGIQTWLDRPMTGWGPGPSRQLMAAAGNPNLVVDTGEVLKHLHNTYVEILVQTGIPGLTLAGLLITLLIRGLLLAHRAGNVPPDLFTFLMSAITLLLLWCLFDYRALNQDWRAFWTLLAGTILSLSLPRNDPQPPTPEPPREPQAV